MSTEQETETAIPVCPFCGGKPFAVPIPGADAMGCQSCAAIGPPIQGAPSPERFDKAMKAWSRRGGVGNVRIAHVKPGVTAETSISAEVLSNQAEKLRDNEYGAVDAMVVLMFDSRSKRLGVVIHRFDETGVKAILEEVLKGFAKKQTMERQVAGGLILPAGAAR